MCIHSYQSVKFFTAICFFIICISPVQGQEQNFWSKVRFGGNVGLGFSDDTFSAIVAPAAVYEFNEWVAGGVGLHFGYSSFDDDRFNEEGRSFNYGASLIGLFNPIPEVQLSVEFEELGVNQRFEIQGEEFKDNYWYPALFVGVGYRTGFISFGMRYDLLYDSDKSIYGNAYAPFVRVFF